MGRDGLFRRYGRRHGSVIQRIIQTLEQSIEWIGKTIAMLALCMALITLAVVVMRYLFDIGSIAMQESVLYMHGALIMLGLPYTMQLDGHVRVDIVYSRLPPYAKSWINLCGHAFFLIPLAIVLIVYSWDYVLASWRVRESSPEVGGIPAVFLLKSLIPLAGGLLIVQALCEMTRQLIAIRHIRD